MNIVSQKGCLQKTTLGRNKQGEGMVFEHPFSHSDNQEKGVFLSENLVKILHILSKRCSKGIK